MKDRDASLSEIIGDASLLEVGRRAVENALIESRDGRMSELGRNNGLVIREADGRDSHIIRFGPETAIRIGLKAIAAELAKREKKA
ncbi:MAG: hypothetical protein V4510_09740 [bacterium]